MLRPYKVDDPAILAAGEDDALIERVVAPGVDDSGVPQQIERIALGEEVTPQAPARGITDLKFANQGGVLQSALFQIAACLWVAIKLSLVEGASLSQHVSRIWRSLFLSQIGESLAE